MKKEKPSTQMTKENLITKMDATYSAAAQEAPLPEVAILPHLTKVRKVPTQLDYVLEEESLRAILSYLDNSIATSGSLECAISTTEINASSCKIFFLLASSREISINRKSFDLAGTERATIIAPMESCVITFRGLGDGHLESVEVYITSGGIIKRQIPNFAILRGSQKKALSTTPLA